MSISQVLDLMREVSNDENTFSNGPNTSSNGPMDGDSNSASSDISGGYHSDSDSTIMMSGNSPFVSKSAKHNFLQRSGNI